MDHEEAADGEVSEESPRTLDPVVEEDPEDDRDSGHGDGADGGPIEGERAEASATVEAATSSAADEGAASSATDGAVSSSVTAETAVSTTAVILQDPNNRAYAEVVWSGRVAWGADMAPADGEDGDREADGRPPRRVTEEAGHEMMPGGRNRIPPHGRAPGPPPPKGGGKGVMAQTPRQMHPNEVHAVVMALMQGQTIPLQYGQWVQWDVNSWVDIAHSYRYGVLFGVQVEVDYPRVGLRQRMPTVPGVNASLPLQPKQVPVVEPDSEEEADPGVPFEHGLSVQAHGKVPPKTWVAHQAKGTLPKPKGPVVPAMAPMPGTLLTKQLPIKTTSMQSPTMGATSTTSPIGWKLLPGRPLLWGLLQDRALQARQCQV